MTPFGNVLADLRKSRNLSQDELAKILGLSKSTISMYERGNREPTFETLEAIADYFNASLDLLVLNKGKRPAIVDESISDTKFELLNMTMQEIIKSERVKIGLSAEDVAAALGISPATMYRYENGDISKLPCALIIPLSKILRISPLTLLGLDENEPTTEPDNKLDNDTKQFVQDWQQLSQQNKEVISALVKALQS